MYLDAPVFSRKEVLIFWSGGNPMLQRFPF